MKKFLFVLVMSVFFLLALSFYLKNPQPVELSYYMDIQYTLPLSLLLWITLCLGILIGWLAALVRHMKIRRRMARNSSHKLVRT